MANIYNEQVKSDLYHQYYTAEGNPSGAISELGQEAKEKSAEYLNSARSAYSDAISIQGQNAMNQLLQNPELSLSPEKLGVEIDKLVDKMSSEIVDDEIKAKFIASASLNKSTYMNNAYAKAIKAEQERQKSTIFNKIYSDIDMIGTAFSNGMQGVSNEDDVINAVLADKDLTSKINAVNADGTFVFSDEQRRKFTTDRDNAILATFKTSFDGMTDEQKKRALSSIESDTMIVGSYSDGKDTSVLVNLKDVVSPKMYSDINKFVRDENDKIRQRAVQEHNLLKKESEINFLKNPTQTNLDEFLALHPNTSETVIDRMMERIKQSPNYNATTRFETDFEAYNGLREVLELPTDTEEQKADMLNRSMEYAEALAKSNVNGELKYEDKEDYMDDLINAMADESIKNRINDLPGLTTLQKMNRLFYTWGSDHGLIDYTFGAISAKKKIGDISHTLASGLLKMAVEGKSKDEILSFYNKNMEEAVKAKYWYIKDLQDKKLVKGETIIDLGHGEPYIFNGFTDGDILITRTK